MLLQWCTLEPSGSSSLAAIRFSSPVRVHTIKIYPTGERPFYNNQDIVSHTEPESFYLNIYFNAITYTRDGEKPKTSNIMVPTTLAYMGEPSSYEVNMAREHATRFMIVQGEYEYVSMAIYGEVLSELPPLPTSYVPRTLPSVEGTPLGIALDPSNMLDPTHLASQLLGLLPKKPPLPLAIRLIWCLKPANDDWDLPEFPYLHPSLAEEDLADLDLEGAYELLARPIPDDADYDALVRYVQRVADLAEKDDDRAYRVAGILCRAASQRQDLGKELLRTLDFPSIFEADDMDEDTLKRLLHATANADIARHLNADWFLQLLDSVTKDERVKPEVQIVASKVMDRIHTWPKLEDALLNSQGDFKSSARLIGDIAMDEQSFGVWLESMVSHKDLVDALAEHPLLPHPPPHPPLLLTPFKAVLHDEFISFLRGFIGISTILSVYAWADSLPHELCRERALGIIRLLQNVDGYREIINHILLLRQMTYRIRRTLPNDPPSRAGDNAEHILMNLCRNPRAFLSPDVIDTALELSPPLSFISEDERVSLREAALISDDGLPSAIEKVMRPAEVPTSTRTLRATRVALAVVERELNERGEWQVLQDFWEHGKCSLVIRLTEVLAPITAEIRSHFSVKQSSTKSQELINQVIRTAQDVLKLLIRLLPSYPLPSRVVRSITIHVADLFMCTEAIDMSYSADSQPVVSAQEARETCEQAIRVLARTALEAGKLGIEIVLRTLLQHGLKSEDRDPTHHIVQVFCLIDVVLPMEKSDLVSAPANWVATVMPSLLHDLWSFCRSLERENKAHLVRRLTILDDGAIGLGEWLLLQELDELQETLHTLEDDCSSGPRQLMNQYRIYLSLRFLLDLVQGDPDSSPRFIESLTTEDETTDKFLACLISLLDQHLSSPYLTELAATLVVDTEVMDLGLRVDLALILLRSAQESGVKLKSGDRLLNLATVILRTLTTHIPQTDRLRLELGRLFAVFGEATLSTSTAEQLIGLMEWISDSAAAGNPHLAELRGLGNPAFTSFMEQVSSHLPEEWRGRFEHVKTKITIAGEMLPDALSTPLPENVQLSMHDIEELFRSTIPAPSTPPRTALNQDALGLVTFSPVAIIRSPAAATGLTKTYSNNDFRQLRQTPTTRQNTSRLPSMHVDDFENASPTLVTVPMPSVSNTTQHIIPTAPQPVNVVPTTLPAMQFVTGQGFQALAPPFDPTPR